MKCIPALLLIFLVCINVAHAEPGGYVVEPYSPQPGPSDLSGADGTETFWDLPLWIQVSWIASCIAAVFGAIKLGPLVYGKVKVLLQNKNSAAILEYIRENPGCTIADVAKNTSINRGTVKYHTCALLLQRKIVWRKAAKHRHLFANGSIYLDRKEVYGSIRNPVKYQILEQIRIRPGSSTTEIAKELRLNRTTVYWYIRQLRSEEMVVSRWDGRHLLHYLVPDVEKILEKKEMCSTSAGKV